jgi:hypothetical protein
MRPQSIPSKQRPCCNRKQTLSFKICKIFGVNGRRRKYHKWLVCRRGICACRAAFGQHRKMKCFPVQRLVMAYLLRWESLAGAGRGFGPGTFFNLVTVLDRAIQLQGVRRRKRWQVKEEHLRITASHLSVLAVMGSQCLLLIAAGSFCCPGKWARSEPQPV